MAHHDLELKLGTKEPALAGYLFDFIRMHGRACGFHDVTRFTFTLEIHLSGSDSTLPNFDELKLRLEQLWPDHEYIYTMFERFEPGGPKKLLRLEEYPPQVEGPTLQDERLRALREELRKAAKDG